MDDVQQQQLPLHWLSSGFSSTLNKMFYPYVTMHGSKSLLEAMGTESSFIPQAAILMGVPLEVWMRFFMLNNIFAVMLFSYRDLRMYGIRKWSSAAPTAQQCVTMLTMVTDLADRPQLVAAMDDVMYTGLDREKNIKRLQEVLGGAGRRQHAPDVLEACCEFLTSLDMEHFDDKHREAKTLRLRVLNHVRARRLAVGWRTTRRDTPATPPPVAFPPWSRRLFSFPAPPVSSARGGAGTSEGGGEEASDVNGSSMSYKDPAKLFFKDYDTKEGLFRGVMYTLYAYYVWSLSQSVVNDLYSNWAAAHSASAQIETAVRRSSEMHALHVDMLRMCNLYEYQYLEPGHTYNLVSAKRALGSLHTLEVRRKGFDHSLPSFWVVSDLLEAAAAAAAAAAAEARLTRPELVKMEERGRVRTFILKQVTRGVHNHGKGGGRVRSAIVTLPDYINTPYNKTLDLVVECKLKLADDNAQHVLEARERFLDQVNNCRTGAPLEDPEALEQLLKSEAATEELLQLAETCSKRLTRPDLLTQPERAQLRKQLVKMEERAGRAVSRTTPYLHGVPGSTVRSRRGPAKASTKAAISPASPPSSPASPPSPPSLPGRRV